MGSFFSHPFKALFIFKKNFLRPVTERFIASRKAITISDHASTSSAAKRRLSFSKPLLAESLNFFHIFIRMKKIIPFLFCIHLLSCSEQKKDEAVPETVLPPAYDTLTIGTKTYFTQNLTDTNYTFRDLEMPLDSDENAVKKLADLVRRDKDSLFLKCDNGKTIKLVSNRSENDNYKLFNFIALDKDIDHYVISCLYVESRDVLLVNKKNGNPLETIGYPVASPDKNYFASGNCDLVAAFDINGISLYKKSRSNYELLGIRELTKWGPVQLVWKNDTSLIIKGNQFKADGESLETMHKVLLIK